MSKFPGLDPKMNTRIRQNSIDQDYIDKLSEKEKQWLNNFMEESVGANFNHEGKKHYKTKAEKRKIYTENNARNRDIMSRVSAIGMLDAYTKATEDYLESEEAQSVSDIEDALIEHIDSKKDIK